MDLNTKRPKKKDLILPWAQAVHDKLDKLDIEGDEKTCCVSCIDGVYVDSCLIVGAIK